MSGENFESLFPITCRQSLIACLLQLQLCDAPEVLFIIDNQYPFANHVFYQLCNSSSGMRKEQDESGALVLVTGHSQGPAMLDDDLIDH